MKNSGLFPRPHFTPELRQALEAARAETLQVLFVALRWVAIITALTYLPIAYFQNAWGSFALYAGLALALLLLSLLTRLSYRWRAGVFIAIVYLTAVTSLATAGLTGAGRLFLLTVTVVATVLFGTRWGLGVGTVSILTWLGFAGLFAGLGFTPSAPTQSAQWLDWLNATASLILTMVALILPQRQFLETQAFALATSQQKAELERAQKELSQQTTELAAASRQLGDANRRLRTQSQALERRAGQLSVSAEVARVAATLHDLPELLDTTVKLISERFGFYHAGIFLLDEFGEWAVLRAANSSGGQRMLARNHRLRVGQQGIVGFVTATGQPRIALNVGEDVVHFRNPDLPETQSEMAVPLRRRTGIIGALDVQSKEVNAFTDDDIATIQTLADQLAVAIDNAQLFQETQRNIEELRLLQREARQSPELPGAVQPQAYRYDGVDTAPMAADDWHAGEITVPIRVGGDTLGEIALYREGLPIAANERQLAQSVAERMGLALENARLFFEARNSAQRMAALSEAALELTGPQFNLPDLLNLIARRARQLLRADSADLWVPVGAGTGEQIELRASYPVLNNASLLGRRLRRGQGLAGRTFEGGQTTIVDDYQTDPGTSTALAVPMIWQNSTLGVLTVSRLQPEWRYTTEDETLARLFAAAAASALSNARLLEETRQQIQELEAINRIAAITRSQVDLYTMLRQVGDEVLKTFGVSSGYIALYDRETNMVEFPYDMDDGTPLPTPPEPLAGGLTAHIIRESQPLLINQDTLERAEALGVIQEGLPALSYLGVPMLVGDEVTGVISVQSPSQEGLFTENDIRLLTIIASNLGVAIENARLFQQTQNALADTEALYQASAELNKSANLQELLANLRRYTLLRDAHTVLLHVFEQPWTNQHTPEWSEILARWSDGDTETPTRRIPLAPWMTRHFKTVEPVIFSDLANDPRLDENSRTIYRVRYGGQSAVFVPLVVSGEWLGYIGAFANELRTVDEADQRRLLSLTQQAAVLTENFRSVTVIERRAEQLAALNRVTEAAATTLDLKQALQTISQELAETFNARNAGIALLNKGQNELTVIAEYNTQPEDTSALGQLIPVAGNASTERVFETRRALVIPNPQTNPLTASLQPLMTQRSVECLLIVPLVVRGEVLGTIGIDSDQPGRVFSDAEVTLAETMAGQISTAIENTRLFQQTQTALAETETLYRSSTDLNQARRLDEILVNLRQHASVLQSTEALLINYFNVPWTDEQTPQVTEVVAADGLASAEVGGRFPVEAWVQSILQPDQLTLIANITSDAHLDERTRQMYVERYQAASVLFVPLVVSGEWLGYLNAISAQPFVLEEADERRLMSLAQQAAVLVENFRNASLLERRAEQLITAAEVSRIATSLLNENQLGQRAVELIRERFNLYYVALFLVEEGGQWAVLKHVSGGSGDAAQVLLRLGHQLEVGGQSMIGWAIANRQPRVAKDVAEERVRFANPLTPDTQSEMALPLVIGDQAIGAFSIQSTQRNAFSESDIAVLQTMADQVAASIQNARLYGRVSVQEFNARALAEIAQAVSGKLDEQEVWATLANKLLEIYKAEAVRVYGWQRDAHQLTTRAVALAEEAPEEVIEPVLGQTLHAKDEPELARVAYSRAAKVRRLALVGEREVRESVATPVMIENAVDSIVEIIRRGDLPGLNPEDLTLLEAAAAATASAVQITRLYTLQLETAERLQEVDRLKSQFLANMSHELRTPLNSIIGFSRVILKGIDGPINETQQQDLTSIYNSGQHLLGLINDILDLSRIEAGKMELTLDEVRLPDIVDGVLSTTRGLVRDKNIQLFKHLPENLPTVHADGTRVRQVLLNLLSNAAKFTEQGSITVAAHILEGESGPMVELSVTDSGTGITPKDQLQLFERFSQVDGSPTRKAGGTGLGLHISRQLVELHGGQIGVKSEGLHGQGATFFFTLPVYVHPEVPPGPEPAEPETPFSARSAPTHPPRVLVIEDQAGLLNLYRRYLEPNGYQLLSAQANLGAVSHAAEANPDAILLDIVMPGQDSWEVLRQLKHSPQTQAIPVIMCTITDERERAKQLGAADYLIKPILETDLTRALERVLNRKHNGTNGTH